MTVLDHVKLPPTGGPHPPADARPFHPRPPPSHTVCVFRSLLVGYDGKDGSQRALDAAVRLAADTPTASITAVIVQHHLPRYGATVGEVDEERQVEAAEARRLASEIQAHAHQHHVAVTILVVPGHPAHELVRLAKEKQADLIVVGHSRHASLRGVLLGGVAEHVTRHAACAVLVVR